MALVQIDFPDLVVSGGEVENFIVEGYIGKRGERGGFVSHDQGTGGFVEDADFFVGKVGEVNVGGVFTDQYFGGRPTRWRGRRNF